MFVYVHKHTYIGTHALRCACGKSKETIISNPFLSRVPTAPGKSGKPAKNDNSFSSPGKVLEFCNFIKNPGKWE